MPLFGVLVSSRNADIQHCLSNPRDHEAQKTDNRPINHRFQGKFQEFCNERVLNVRSALAGQIVISNASRSSGLKHNVQYS